MEWRLSAAVPSHYPDYVCERMTIQDCWRQYGNQAEQAAVRELLRRMNIEVVEMAENREHTRFCGTSLYRPAPPRNLKMAPKRFVEDAEGMFVTHTEEEQKTDGRTLPTISDKKGCCLLPLLHRRVTTCWSAPLSYSRTAVPI